MLLLLFALGCTSSSELWWQNEDANPYNFDVNDSDETDVEDEDDDLGVYGILLLDDDVYAGEIGVEVNGCTWYGPVTGVTAESCTGCDLAVTISTEEVEVFESDGCPNGFAPDDFSDRTFTVGFSGDTTWMNQDGEWSEWGYYFQEEEYHIWFVPFE